YRSVFSDIAHRECEGFDTRFDLEDFPTFGYSDSPWDPTVKQFYSFWSAFSSGLSFGWYDKWDVRQAEGRRMRRAMEQENSRERKSKKKDYNDKVRHLVEYVRNRDPRVAKQRKIDEEEAEKVAQQRLEDRKRKEELKKERRARAREVQEKRWAENEAEVAAMARKYGGSGKDEEQEEEEEVVQDVYECAACKKVFKSHKAYANHEKSKKHKEAVEKLRRTLMEDDAFLESLAGSSEESSPVLEKSVDEEEEEKAERSDACSDILEVASEVSIEVEDNSELIEGFVDAKRSENDSSSWEKIEHGEASSDSESSDDEIAFGVFVRSEEDLENEGLEEEKSAVPPEPAEEETAEEASGPKSHRRRRKDKAAKAVSQSQGTGDQRCDVCGEWVI
ncbi:DnaJ sub C member 21, partial [Perkinsus chesapeaki]